MKRLFVLPVFLSILAAAPVGIFTDVSGTVQLKQDKAEEWIQVKQGDAIGHDCMIVAADGGKADIMFFDGDTKFTLLPKSAAKIKANPHEFAGDKKVQLKLGTLIGEAGGGKKAMLKIFTETTQVQADKARFIVSTLQNGTTRVNSLNGRVVVINKKQKSESSIWDGKEIVSDAKGMVQGISDPKRIEKIITAAGDESGIKGNKKIVLNFKGEGKQPKRMSILLKERKH